MAGDWGCDLRLKFVHREGEVSSALDRLKAGAYSILDLNFLSMPLIYSFYFVLAIA
ncbi:hypothetical protein N431DRAFT_428947 [Stipitochalara longipes BDJ]|nr:hypothetical protein N431DRAFT_428947 [Stipitochalara longipes BDJ]